MSDIKLTNERMKTYDGGKGIFKTGAALEAFGEKQNAANEMLAANINDLIKRVCALEDKQVQNNEIMKKIASELTSFKAEIDRLKLTAKLNTNTIARLNNAIDIAVENSAEDGE